MGTYCSMLERRGVNAVLAAEVASAIWVGSGSGIECRPAPPAAAPRSIGLSTPASRSGACRWRSRPGIRHRTSPTSRPRSGWPAAGRGTAPRARRRGLQVRGTPRTAPGRSPAPVLPRCPERRARGRPEPSTDMASSAGEGALLCEAAARAFFSNGVAGAQTARSPEWRDPARHPEKESWNRLRHRDRVPVARSMQRVRIVAAGIPEGFYSGLPWWGAAGGAEAMAPATPPLLHHDRGSHLVSGHVAEKGEHTGLFGDEPDLLPALRRDDHALKPVVTELRRPVPGDVEVHADEETDRHEGMQLHVVVLEDQFRFLSGTEHDGGWLKRPGSNIHDDLLLRLRIGRRERWDLLVGFDRPTHREDHKSRQPPALERGEEPGST